MMTFRGTYPEVFQATVVTGVCVGVATTFAVCVGVGCTAAGAAGSRLRLAPGVRAGEVLDAVRAHHEVTDFGVEAPSLAELFLAAAGDVSAGALR